jgi:hypoxanthine phosphoribosyltransferase
MLEDIQSVLISKEEIAAAVEKLGRQISEDYKDRDLVLVSVLKGSVVFMADLMRAVTIPVSIDFMAVSSYGGTATASTGVVRILKDLDSQVAGKDILLVEDILDSGKTLSYLREHVHSKGARSIRIATLLDKPERRMVDIRPDYRCFVVPDEFVVGYGLDFNERYRNLAFVGVLRPQAYEK